MHRRTWFNTVIVVALLSASVGAWAQSSRVSDAELRLVQKQERKEREQLYQQWAVISHSPELVASQKRWEAATDRVCRPPSSSVEHQVEASRCKSARYRLRRTYLLEVGTN